MLEPFAVKGPCQAPGTGINVVGVLHQSGILRPSLRLCPDPHDDEAGARPSLRCPRLPHLRRHEID